MMEQFPSAFEFTDTYLMTLWDSMFSGIFGTFVFNSEKQRVRTCRGTGGNNSSIKLATVWAWTLQYSKSDQNLFNNPLYVVKQMAQKAGGGNGREGQLRQLMHDMQPDYAQGCNMGIYRSAMKQRMSSQRSSLRSGRRTPHKKTKPILPTPPPQPQPYQNPNINGANSTSSNANQMDLNILIPSLSAPLMQFWTACYLRWIPSVHIVGGGQAMLYKQQCELVDEIQHLKLKIKNLKIKSPVERSNGTTAADITEEENNMFFTHNKEGSGNGKNNHPLLTSAFPYSISDLSLIGGDRRSFLGTPLARFLTGQSLMDAEGLAASAAANTLVETDEVEL